MAEHSLPPTRHEEGLARSNVTPNNEVARGLAEARSMSRDEIFAKMDSLLNDGDRAILAEKRIIRALQWTQERMSTATSRPAAGLLSIRRELATSMEPCF